jgi:translation initiation factor 3 subunit J
MPILKTRLICLELQHSEVIPISCYVFGNIPNHLSTTGTSSKELDSLISAQPRTKEDFIKLSSDIITYIIKRHQDKPLYPTFVEHHVRELAAPLRDVEVRKAASGLTTLANEKQKEQRDKTAGKKKTKAAMKPGLGSTKVSGK